MRLTDREVEAIAQKVATDMKGERKPVVAGNWKMNMTPRETERFLEDLTENRGQLPCEVLVAPPMVCLETASRILTGKPVGLAAQNVHWEEKGAFTGEASTQMLIELGVTYAIVGHSERRQYFGETDDTVGQRAKAAINAGLVPIICVGELLSEREAGETMQVVGRQVRAALANFEAQEVARTILAYEPVWAIGTGKTASTEQAQDAHRQIRELVAELYDERTAQSVRIQYGGSVKPGNAKALLGQPDIDGALVGGASLKVGDFIAICQASGVQG